MVVLADAGDAVDEGVDDAAQSPASAVRSVLERADPDDEPVVEDVRLELERVRLHRRRERRGREGELVDAVDRKVEPRAEAAENERDTPAPRGRRER